MKKTILSLCIILKCAWSIAQYDSDSVTDIKGYLYNEVYKNVAAYNIKNAAPNINGTRFLGDNFYAPFLADYGYHLRMQIDTLGWKYPVPHYDLYKVYIKDFSYEDTKHHIVLSDNTHFTTHRFLVALDKRNGMIKFISGQFFTTNLSGDFKIDVSRPESLLDYLRYRTFYLLPRDITFLKKSGEILYYKGYSDEYGGDFDLHISSKYPENIAVTVSKKHTKNP